MKKIATNNNEILCWCENPEQGAVDQAKILANQPWIVGHVALMPDTHQGYGMPIGGVIACDNVVVPNAVGMDVGCGMAAVKTSLTSIDKTTLKNIMILIRKWIPVGFNSHSGPQDSTLMPSTHDLPLNAICKTHYNHALKQLGTLGGGNHFIEIQEGDDGYIWFMLHSGSRALGYAVCNHYAQQADAINQQYYSYTKDLGFLPMNSDIGRAYWAEMQFALNYAQANRDLMVQRVQHAFRVAHLVCSHCRGKGGSKGQKCPFCEGGLQQGDQRNIYFDKPINIHHNYASIEHHFGKNVVVHRKGATLARTGVTGIIPGSQGTSSYIVRGKGDKASMNSCSHGAGRKMSRTRAQKTLNLDNEKGTLDAKGIIHAIRTKKDLDEASGAYKDIETVMDEQKDLVDILVKLSPLAVVKG